MYKNQTYENGTWALEIDYGTIIKELYAYYNNYFVSDIMSLTI